MTHVQMSPFLRRQAARLRPYAGANGWALLAQVADTPQRNCNGMPVEEFFPTTDEDSLRARRLAERHKAGVVCAGCPVAEACLAGAVLRGERYGTWGGVAQPDFQALVRVFRAQHHHQADAHAEQGVA